MKKTVVIVIILVLVATLVVFLLTHNKGGAKRASIEKGGKLYEQYCLSCHQGDGTGVPGLNPPLKNSPYVQGNEEELIRIVLNGRTEGVKINGETYTNPMPPFGSVLKDQEIADVLTFVRNSFENKANAISEEQVKAARK